MEITIILFIFGAVLGSFLNVLATRYNPNKFILDPAVIGGRSHCDNCGKTLRAYELIPIISFVLQRGRCRSCGAVLSLQYPVSEMLSGVIVAATPSALRLFALGSGNWLLLSALWTAALLVLLLISLIDLRLNIIPDETIIFLSALSLPIILLSTRMFGLAQGSFVGPYALLLGFRGNIWLNHFFGAASAGSFFLLLYIITRGRGMGMGDVKLAFALGFLFGWPDVGVAGALAFIIGSLFGVIGILRHKNTMKSALPFGPFLALGAALTFFFGAQIMSWYFGLLLL
jgi:prepilin signal peptidase PulO-like enzyme (type II secretory pathway)